MTDKGREMLFVFTMMSSFGAIRLSGGFLEVDTGRADL